MQSRNNIEYWEAEREDMVEREVSELLSNEYKHTTKENFGEFMQNMNDAELEGLLEWIKEYEANPKEFTLACLGRSLYIASQMYWKDMAIDRAKRTTPSVRELLTEHKYEVAEHRYEQAKEEGRI